MHTIPFTAVIKWVFPHFFSQSPSRIFSTDGEVVPSHALGKRSTVEHTHAHSQTAAGGHPQGAVLLAVP